MGRARNTCGNKVNIHSRSAVRYTDGMSTFFSSVRPYLSLESGIAVAVLTALLVYFFSGYALFAQYILTAVIVFGIAPLIVDITRSIVAKEFGVDVIALLAIVASLLIGEYAAAGLILLMLSGGESLERFAEGKARGSLEKLLAGAPTVAHKIVGDSVVDVSLHDIAIGDVVLVKQKEIVPVDGTLVLGTATIDESMITGEPMGREISVHDRVYSGSVNGESIIHVRVDKAHADSTYASIVRLVQKAEEEKAPMVRLADRYSIVFTAITLVIAGIAYFVLDSSYLAVAVLVVATPCPLILAAPIAFIAGMSRAAKKGIIVKHGGVFEGVTNAKEFFFDKTGTLTFGTPTLVTITPVKTGLTKEQVLTVAGSLEQLSTHIIARSVLATVKIQKTVLTYPDNFSETFGKGVVGTIDGKVSMIGKKAYLSEHGVTVSENLLQEAEKVKARGGIFVYVGQGTEVIGTLEFEDSTRESVGQTLQSITDAGYTTVLVTGDTKVRAETLREKLHLGIIYADCLPEDKVAKVVASENAGRPVVMIGDGVNDAPALAAASVGVALGSHGETASTDAADAVILVDDIDRVADLVRISKGTMRIARQSIFAGIGFSVLAMIIALLGYLPPTTGALVQEAIDVVVILNALRVLRV